MAITDSDLKDRFEGCLLGLAIGDALDAKFEAQSADAIRSRIPTTAALIAYPQEEIWYTDDAQDLPVQIRARLFWGTLTVYLTGVDGK